MVKRRPGGDVLGVLSLLAAAGAFVMLAAPALAGGAKRGRPGDEFYVRKSTWQETVLASRERYLKSRTQVKKEEVSGPVQYGTWYATGPLKAKSFKEMLSPELGVELEARGDNGKPLWGSRPNFADGRVHGLPGSGRCSTYLYRVITAGKAERVKVGLGSDDGIEVWLNDKLLLSKDVNRGPGPNQDMLTLKLAKGENHLLLKIHNTGGGHGFYFGVAGAKAKQDDASRLWGRISRDFGTETAWMREDVSDAGLSAWLKNAGSVETEQRMIARALGKSGGALQKEFDALRRGRTPPTDRRWLDLYVKASRRRQARADTKHVNPVAMRLAIEDLTRSFPSRYPKGREFLDRLDECEAALTESGGEGDASENLVALQREALLANPLLDFEKLLVIRRSARSPKLGLPQNWQGNCAIKKTGYDDSLVVLSPVRPGGGMSTLFKPEKTEFVGDVDLHFDGDRMIFSMPGSHGRWQIWEIKADGTGLRQVTPGEYGDVDNYDPCYLPNGKILFGSTRAFHGVPCVGGGNTVANLCIMDADGKNIRQLCFDQDHNWSPAVLNNGRVIYSRWEYSDSPHYFTRLLFHMNPDGTGQAEYYGSNSLWPNSNFYARPIPGHPTKVVSIISGHHGVPRMGELVIFDPAQGRQEADGAVQRIPGYKKAVPPRVADGLVNGSWPKFLHPYPLSENYFLVSSQPTNKSLWGVYLVDIFDNMLLIAQEPGYALLEPLPFRKTRTPPVIPDRVKLGERDSIVYLSNVYAGEGLRGVPHGVVKKLRVYEIHYAYPRMGGHISIGIDGPWDVHRIHGTVPVFEDGSTIFNAPANIPLAVQPLDAEGKAIQVMRSWYTAMPGEFTTCVGCHDKQNRGPQAKATIAARTAPVDIDPWYGPARGFSFKREVQPVLDKHCAGCHDGKPRKDGKTIPNFADTGKGWRGFTKSYIALHPYVRRPGPESDYYVQKSCEWHTSTSELFQMLEKGHQGVKLDKEAWDRLTTWVDLNVPDHGTWGEHRKIHGNMRERRLEYRTKFANRPEDPEAYPSPPPERARFVKPDPVPARRQPRLNVARWPFDADEAKRRQAAGSADSGLPRELKIDLGGGKTMELILVPAGEFVMGDASGFADENPMSAVKIAKPFYIGKLEVSNEQYGIFDPNHDSAYISVYNKDVGYRGETANRGTQPVMRVPWKRAVAFCEWLSKRTAEKTGRTFSLPTEAQWEYACRAGTDTPLNWGGCDVDFGKLANLADQRVVNLCRRDSPKWIPSVKNVNDGSIVTDNVGKYQPNAFGLYDTHGNVCEWTRSLYKPYPYREGDGRNDLRAKGKRVARGGSFYDRPARARSAFRLAFRDWQCVYNVGFRIVCEVGAGEVAAAK